MSEEDEFLGCISCMSSNDLCNLFSEDNGETYASMFKTCFGITIPENVKFLCLDCGNQLKKAYAFRQQTAHTIALRKDTANEEEYLDETILAEEDDKESKTDDEALRELKAVLEDDDGEDVDDPQYAAPSLRECSQCGVAVAELEQHQERCHGGQPDVDVDTRKYPCHFCENVYISKKACFTHLRMKHGLKLCTEQTGKLVQRERKKCHICSRDFSQKQILNKHLLKAHGLEVEKRKAFVCPLCAERVSYGTHFSAHLLRVHGVREHVQQLQFRHMDDFLLFKSAVQEETKFRYRKTTASKQTIEGVRSHYMCSQSGVYVYQGKGKRPAPERQIYKTGKACPAHMIVTETLDNVQVTFYKTHVGHGPCPYFEPREQQKKPKPCPSSYTPSRDADSLAQGVVCDACGLVCTDGDAFKTHAHTHAMHMYACQYCDHDFEDIQVWTHHMKVDHNMTIF